MADAKEETKQGTSTSEVVAKDEKVEPPQGTTVKKDVQISEKKIAPPPASNFTVVTNGKATSYARRFAKPEDLKKEDSTPGFTDDFFTKINMAMNLYLDTGPEQVTIDCQPDYRNIFLYLTYYCSKIYTELSIKENPMITPPSLMAYFLSLIYGHALIGETANIRNNRSPMANAFTAEDYRRDLLNVLQSLPTPPFIKKLLQSLMPTNDPRRPGIQFVHSLACFLMLHDYGRAYPITAFMKAHNYIATRQANIDPNETRNNWLDSTLLVNEQNVTLLYVRNIFGARTPVGTYPSDIIQAIDTLFNPVTQRANLQRNMLARLATFPYVTPFDNNLNPYIYLLGADEDNCPQVTSFLTSMASHIQHDLKCTDVLGACFSSSSGIEIMVHYYSNMSFPTYFPGTDGPVNAEITARTYATQVGFMTPRIDDPNRLPIPYPAEPAQNQPPVEIAEALYMRPRIVGPYDPDTDPDDVNLFITSQHVTPDVIYFHPWDYIPTTFAQNVANGLHIETSGISSVSIPMQKPEDPLTDTNSQFLNSAIPAHMIKIPALITRDNPFEDFEIYNGNAQNQIVRLGLFSAHLNRYPRFDATVAEPANTPLTTVGFHATPHIGKLRRMTNTFAFKHGTADECETTSAWPDSTLYIWSSYRYYNTKIVSSSPQISKISFIANWRTVYGTNVTMARSKHPFRLIPKA